MKYITVSAYNTELSLTSKFRRFERFGVSNCDDELPANLTIWKKSYKPICIGR